MRYGTVPFGQPIGWKPVNYLLEVGFTRDVWAHRIDIHAAIGRPVELDPAHDERLVADIVAEWARSAGNRSSCFLTGTAGGPAASGGGGAGATPRSLQVQGADHGGLVAAGELGAAVALVPHLDVQRALVHLVEAQLLEELRDEGQGVDLGDAELAGPGDAALDEPASDPLPGASSATASPRTSASPPCTGCTPETPSRRSPSR